MKQWNIKLDGTQLNTQEILFNLECMRGINDIPDFISPSGAHLIPFDKLHNIDRAKDIILNTIETGKTFLVYADVDLDGCCSAAIMYRYLKNYTDNIKTHINKNKAHGIQSDFDFDILNDIDTIIIVDSINDTPEMYQKILKMGKRLIVIDHHVPENEILEIKDDICLVSSAVDYPNPYLSGSGVTWKVVKYIDDYLENNYANLLVDLAASGIIGDVCDVGVNSMENRYICFLGLNNLQNPALKKVIGNYDFNATSVSYSIAPLINSAHRTGHNEEALDFFLTDNSIELSDILNNLNTYKEFQKQEINRIYTEVILPQVKDQIDNKCLYFMTDSSTFKGVVAGRVADEFSRPVMILTASPDGKYFSGSMRSVGVENFRDIVNNSQYAHCMGHELSAGVNIEADKFFTVYQYIENQLSDYTFDVKTDVDILLNPTQITSYLVDAIKRLNKICGQGFKPIQVGISNINSYKLTKMSDGKHLNVKLDSGLSAIKWNVTDWDLVKENKTFSAIGTLDQNTFRGKTTPQLIMNDFKFI